MSESFERGMKIFRENLAGMYDNGHMTKCADVDTSVDLDRLQRAHDHELEQARKAEYARGYEDGRRSKDADHAAVVLRLSRLTFDGGSHENLSKIAYAVYPCATGWTCESSEGLRDRLIDLLGGVHEHHCDTGCDCACGDSSAGDSGEHTEAMTYDVLGNERHKVVCRLREYKPRMGGKPTEEASKLIRCITGNDDSDVAYRDDLEETRDRLIHLLGGDQPTLSDLYGILQDGAESENKGAESMYEMTKNAEIGELDGDGTCPNNDTTSSITDELRDYLGENGQEYDNYKGEMIGSISGGLSPIYVIADRIDEQAKTLEHDVEMWRDRSEDMRMERDDLQERLDRSRTEYCETCEEAETCDQLRAKLEEADAAIANWRERERSFEESERERDELQKRLDEMREQREHWASEATKIYRLFFPHEEYGMPNEPSEMVVHKINELQAKLDAIREALDGNH